MTLALDIHLRRGDFAREVHIHDDARVIALSGHSGAGKTSVLNAIAGLLRPQHGRIDIDGRCLYDSARGIDMPTHRREIGYVFQDLRLFPHLDVRSNLDFGKRKAAAPRFGFDEVVALLGIEHLLERRTTHLSGGEAQRVAIGRALLSQPRLLLLDEPLSSLDRARREELIPYLQRVRDETALPMILISHDEDELRQMTDAIHRFE